MGNGCCSDMLTARQDKIRRDSACMRVCVCGYAIERYQTLARDTPSPPGKNRGSASRILEDQHLFPRLERDGFGDGLDELDEFLASVARVRLHVEEFGDGQTVRETASNSVPDVLQAGHGRLGGALGAGRRGGGWPAGETRGGAVATDFEFGC